MNSGTTKLKRGATSPNKPGLLFMQYKNGKEYWVTPEQFEHNRKLCAERAKLQYLERREARLKAMAKWLAKPGNLEIKRKAYHTWVASPEGRKVRREISTRNRQTINGTISNRIWARIAVALKVGFTKSADTLSLIGCSISDFKKHIESQFQSGMSWDNFAAWEIDHRVPLASFNLSDPEQQKLAFNYHNCQPMWVKPNRQKSDWIEHEGKKIRGRDLRKHNIIPFPQEQKTA